MDQILSRSPIGVAVIDFYGRYVDFNPAYSELYKYDAATLKNELFTIVFSPEQREQVLQLHQSFLAKGGELRGEWDVVRHDGVNLTIISDSVKMESDTGEALRLVYVLDITQRRRTEQALLQSERRFAAIVETAMDAVICLDASYRICLFNAAAERMFCYAAKTILGQPLDVLIPEELRKVHPQYIAAFASTGHTSRRMGSLGQLLACRASGERFPIEAAISHGVSNGESIFTVIVRDVTKQVRAKAELEAAIEKLGQANVKLLEMAQVDQLTNLPNRRMFFDRLHLAMSQSKRRATSVCVAFIDLDGFKAINDEYGHDAGDALLVELSSRLREQLREGDTLARLGGDEFVALLIDVQSLEQCLPTIERILHCAAQPVYFKGMRLQVSASIGMALSENDATAADLIRQADTAMYRAKRAGKNTHAIFSKSEN